MRKFKVIGEFNATSLQALKFFPISEQSLSSVQFSSVQFFVYLRSELLSMVNNTRLWNNLGKLFRIAMSV
jgi:hypothetical protein